MVRTSVLAGAFPDRAVEGLVRDLDAALSRDEVRASYLAVAERTVVADGIGFYRLGPTAWASPQEITANLRADFLAAYEADGRADDPVLRMAVASRAPAHSRVVERKSWDGCASRHVLGDAGLRHSLQVPVITQGQIVGTLNFARSGPRAFDDADLVVAGGLATHLSAALERAHRFEQAQSKLAQLEAVLNIERHVSMVSTADGAAIFVSQEAKQLVGAGSSFDSSTQLGRSMARAVRDFAQEGAPEGTRCVISSDGGVGLSLQLHRVSDPDLIVCAITLDGGPDVVLPVLRVLSPREQEIAEMVARGWTSKRIAERAFISENTVKQHLKRIFFKLQISNRAELVQTMWAKGEQ